MAAEVQLQLTKSEAEVAVLTQALEQMKTTAFAVERSPSTTPAVYWASVAARPASEGPPVLPDKLLQLRSGRRELVRERPVPRPTAVHSAALRGASSCARARVCGANLRWLRIESTLRR